jgi:hypothetical protein
MILKQLLEEVQPLDPGMDLDEQMAILEKRMAAARRGIGITNRMPDSPERTKHRSRVMGNLNTIRAQLNKVIKTYAEFEKAADDYERGFGYRD